MASVCRVPGSVMVKMTVEMEVMKLTVCQAPKKEVRLDVSRKLVNCLLNVGQ